MMERGWEEEKQKKKKKKSEDMPYILWFNPQLVAIFRTKQCQFQEIGTLPMSLGVGSYTVNSLFSSIK